MVNIYIKNQDKYDYVNNTLERTYPRGYDIEIFSFEALEEAFNKAKLKYEREHVTPYIYDQKNNFRILCYKNNQDYSKYRITLDTKEDLKVIESIYE